MAIENTPGNGYDIPRDPAPSSVGNIEYPPGPASEQRRKGIFHSVIEQSGDFVELSQDLAAFPFDAETTRYSIRTFVTANALLALSPSQRASVTPFVEGIIPLHGCGNDAFEDVCLVYTGRNHPSRITPPDEAAEAIERVNRIFHHDLPPPTSSAGQLSYAILSEDDREDPRVLADMAGLYRAFGWEPDDVTSLLTNRHNVLIAARDEGHIVSTGMAERAEIPVRRAANTIPFIMYELTEAATLPSHRGRGIYTQVAAELMSYLSRTDVNLAYAESNVRAEGVLRAGKRLGRRTSTDALASFGFPPRLLERHVRISEGPGDNRPEDAKNDLLPTYLTRYQLLNVHGNRT